MVLGELLCVEIPAPEGVGDWGQVQLLVVDIFSFYRDFRGETRVTLDAVAWSRSYLVGLVNNTQISR